ncbi:precorrin-6A reductase [Huintestinicola sp.]|uniref:precorrin-6A reductase n=1 Tax=Huintestinicola sp. TaxID=2981661 RepID=UPI003D7CCE71
MNKFLIFGGTTEGRLLAEYCDKNKIFCTVSVATEYGAELLPRSEFVAAETGRKDRSEIAELILSCGFAAVFDATHPYAAEVGKNISGACSDTNTPYYRVIREPSPLCEEALYFDTADMAADFAWKTSGTFFIATGSKELPLFCRDGLPERCIVRVLPDENVIRECEKMGFMRIISGKGPFGFEENVQHFRGCGYVITKESGSAGGFEEKRQAAAAVGAKLIIIKRPVEKGMSLLQAEKLLSELSESGKE